LSSQVQGHLVVGYLSAGGLENVFQLVIEYSDSNENFWIEMYQIPNEGRGVPMSLRMCFDVLSGTILAQTNDEAIQNLTSFFFLHEWQAIYKEFRAEDIDIYTTSLFFYQ